MIVESDSLPDGHRLSAPVVVVGAGPAGIAVASRLASRGHHVLMLEAGPLHEDRRSRRDADARNLDAWYYRVRQSRARGFGGTSQRWAVPRGVRLQPLDPIDFERRSGIPHSGWPIGADEVARYQSEAAEGFLRLPAGSYDVDDWATPGRPALGLLSDDVQTTIFRFAPAARISDRLAEIAADPRIQVLVNAAVTEIRTGDGTTGVTGLSVVSRSRRRFTVSSRVIVLACGGIDNARLLLASHRDRGGLGNSHDLVGRFFMEHPHARSGVVRLTERGRRSSLGLYEPHDVGEHRIQGKLRLHPEVVRRHSVPNSAWWVLPRDVEVVEPAGRALVDLRDLLEFRRWLPGTGKRITTLATSPRRAARALRQHRSGPPVDARRCLQLAFMAEQIPNPASRVTIGRQTDRFGAPIAQLDWRLTADDRDGVRRTQDLLDGAFRRAGLGRLDGRFWGELPRPNLGAGYHHMGTTRMATSPTRGVVDPDGQVHGVDGLFVAGSSVFPTVGYANPTLTIVTLAIRLADHLHPRLRTQRPLTG